LLLRHRSVELLLFAYRNKHLGTVHSTDSEPVLHPKAQAVVRHLNENYHQSLALPEVAAMFRISPHYLSRLFKQTTGFTFSDYLNLLRVKEAQRLLRESEDSITEIALQAGFSNFSHFGKMFKRTVQVSPRTYRQEYREAGPDTQERGKLGEDFTTEQGYDFARNAAIEVLAVVQEVLGSLDRVKRVVKVQGFINATASFQEHHKVLNGCSDLMLDVFGEQGVHARSVFGAVSVRDNLPLIIDSIFQVEETSRAGEGLMTEAVRGIEQFAINCLKANRLEIRCDARNVRSAKVAERAGYTLEGVLRKMRRDSTGELVDMMVFAKVRGDEFE
ncbi:hypothetical protein G195_000708, partial [Phytophthora kernoviae 00238/432]